MGERGQCGLLLIACVLAGDEPQMVRGWEPSLGEIGAVLGATGV